MARKAPNKLWIFVVCAFLALSAAWAVLITVAQRNQPERVPLVK